MSPAALEPEEAVVAFRQWLSSLGKKVYFTGPLVPDGANADAGEKTASPVGQQIHAFLDRQLQEKGKHSVLYVCLLDGTVARPPYSREIVDFVWLNVLPAESRGLRGVP